MQFTMKQSAAKALGGAAQPVAESALVHGRPVNGVPLG